MNPHFVENELSLVCLLQPFWVSESSYCNVNFSHHRVRPVPQAAHPAQAGVARPLRANRPVNCRASRRHGIYRFHRRWLPDRSNRACYIEERKPLGPPFIVDTSRRYAAYRPSIVLINSTWTTLHLRVFTLTSAAEVTLICVNYSTEKIFLLEYFQGAQGGYSNMNGPMSNGMAKPPFYLSPQEMQVS